jgi:antitoxin component of MazEF toxin-antitoxin module
MVWISRGFVVLAQIKKLDGNLILQIPKDLIQALDLREGTQLMLEPTTNGLLLKPTISKRRSTKNLETLLQGITPENIHREQLEEVLTS